MKARVKRNGHIIDVEKHLLTFANGEKRIYYRDIFSTEDYQEEEIEEMVDDEITSNPDWQAYRLEVAKECLAGMMYPGIKNWGSDARQQVRWAVQYADTLIEELKKTEP